MANDIIIVAIPQAHTRIWDVSSEKVPHMTLLYLGEVNWAPEVLSNVLEYVNHASSMFHNFGMFVEKRGTLGSDEADVLFFDKNREVLDFRNNLLGNDAIRTAHNEAQQFPTWIPHLTLGYPETPAKEDDHPYEVMWVDFDRIAVWTGDYEGPSFELKSLEHVPIAAMSDVTSDAVETVLTHYGVKGMKWGVRKRASGGKPATTKTRYSKPPAKLSNAELARRIKRLEMEKRYNQLNARDLTEGQRLTLDILSTSGRRLATQVLTEQGGRIIRERLTGR